jgi:hypothetical protein
MHHGTRRLLYHNGHLSRTWDIFHAGIHPTYRPEAARLVLFRSSASRACFANLTRPHSFAFDKVADSSILDTIEKFTLPTFLKRGN